MKTISEIMKAVGCHVWPERWEDFYEEEMLRYEEVGCLYLTPSYYDELSARYHILDRYLGLYKEAVSMIAQDDNLARVVVVVCRAMEDRAEFIKEVSTFPKPVSPDGSYSLAYAMFQGVVVCSGLTYCHAKLRERNLPEDIIVSVMNVAESGVDAYRIRNEGRMGYDFWSAAQFSLDAKMFTMGRLQIEIFCGFRADACVFEAKDGRRVALAHGIYIHRSGYMLGARSYDDEAGSWKADIAEFEDCWEGYPYLDNGHVDRRRIRLDKSEWQKVLSKGDPVVGLHIPSGGGLTPQKVDEAIALAKTFLATYYPDYHYKAFECTSWLMDPQLIQMVGEESNIAAFSKRFSKLAYNSFGTAVFTFVFLTQPDKVVLKDLPECTKLERELKKLYLSGGFIHEMTGYFFP